MAFLSAGDAALGAAPAAPESVPSDHEPRSQRSLSEGWRFRFGADVPGAKAPGFDDGDWQRVQLPHTWNNVGSYSLTRSADNDTRRGVGWYRLDLDMPQDSSGQRHFLQFDGVGTVAEVWVNGVRVGQHQGAFSRFRFDVTAQIRSGRPNVIAVKADNSKAEPASATEHVIPLGGDFFIHGGLYRDVSLISTSGTHIDLLDHGGPGVYISTPTVTSERAEVSVLTRVRNLESQPRDLALRVIIRDAEGRVVARDESALSIGSAETVEARRGLALDRPHLWQGRSAPYLYTATVELVAESRVIDRVSEVFGVRTFAFDPDRGFMLNGTPVPLRGASRHQDRAGQGWALTPVDHAQDLAIMAEMGVNTVRHAHYQHAQEWVSEADRAGMAVWAELPFVHESSLHDGEPTPEVITNARTQLIELIRQNFNHPSIVTWSIGNEVDIRPALEALKSGRPTAPARSLDMLTMMNDLAHSEDPSRPTSYADCCENTAIELPGSQVLSGVADLTGYNRYFGWYYGSPEELGPALDALRARYPGHPIAVAEYGGGAALTQHTDNPEGGPINAFGRPHPEEFQSWVHEQSWPQLADRPYLAGNWIWNMFDFASTTREEGEATDLNDKGLVSYDRLTRKDAFYYYKANWSSEPVLHLTGRRYVDRAYPVVDVRAYASSERATLSLNGRSVGSADCPGHICVWPGVGLSPGENILAISSTEGDRVLTDSLRWVAPDPEQGLAIDAGTLTGSNDSRGRRFGSDNFFVGGTGRDINDPGVGRRRAATVEAILDTEDSSVFGSYREGQFRYLLPLPNGRWSVSLSMTEPSLDPALERSFDVTANGQTVLSAVNPARAAGGARRALIRSFEVEVSDEQLELGFVPVTGDAIVSAIVVTRPE